MWNYGSKSWREYFDLLELKNRASGLKLTKNFHLGVANVTSAVSQHDLMKGYRIENYE